jgi:Protein of unknown function (DUF4038)/Putative collagen-binding domain of a collagenase
MSLPLLKISNDRRALETTDGAPFFYLADTVWELFHRATREDAERLLSDRAAKGFNAIQVVALAELDGLRTPNVYGEPPFAGDGLDPAYPNEPYWAHVDWIVRRANELGLYVAMLPSWGDKWFRNGWGLGPEIFSSEQPERARAYAEWLGRRYRDAAIVWVTGGDRALRHAGDVVLMRAFAEGLRAGDGGRHLITFHPPGGTSSSRYVHPEPWLDFQMIQSGHDRARATWAMIEHDWDLLPTRPLVNGEPAYEAHPNAFKNGDAGWLDQADVRREFYWSLCMGAAGFTYGCHAVWQLWQAGREPVNGPRAHWRESLDLPGAAQVGIGARFALTLARRGSRLQPAWWMLDVPYTGDCDLPRAGRSEDGAWMVAYLPIGQRVGVKLARLMGEHFRVRWFDPRDATEHDGGTHGRGEILLCQAPYSPAGRDWVLVVEDAAKPYAAF